MAEGLTRRGGAVLSRPMSTEPESTSRSEGAAARERRDRDARQKRVGYQMFGIGWMSASEAIAGLLLGWLIDRGLGTAPWGLVGGGVTGVVVGMWTLVRRAMHLQESVGGAGGNPADARLGFGLSKKRKGTSNGQ